MEIVKKGSQRTWELSPLASTSNHHLLIAPISLIQKTSGHSPGKPALGEHAWAGRGWTRWSAEVPSDLNHCHSAIFEISRKPGIVVGELPRIAFWGVSQELQACQPDLDAREDYGVIHPECDHWACEGQPGNQAQPAWVHERQVLLNNPDLLYDQVAHLVDERKAVDVIHLDFCKAFDTIPHSILLEKLAAHGLDVCVLHWVKN